MIVRLFQKKSEEEGLETSMLILDKKIFLPLKVL